MTTKNPYRKNSHFETKQTRKIIRMFAEDLTASKTSDLLGIERKTINDWYQYIRHTILRYTYAQDKEIRG
jgi:transposase-like protein